MRALQRFVEVHADFGQTQENPDHGSRRIKSRLVHISIKTRSKLERRLIGIRAEFLQNSSGVTQDFEGIQAGFRQGLGKVFTVKCHP